MFGAKHLNSIHAGHYKNTAGLQEYGRMCD